MQASHASALESIEYRVAFDEPSADVRGPIAAHVRDILAICRQTGVARSAMKPVLVQLADLHRQDEQRLLAPPPPPPPPPSAPSSHSQRYCSFCDSPDALIDEELYRVCAFCGFIAETHCIRDSAWLQPGNQAHCGTPQDARSLDKTSPAEAEASLARIHASIRQLCAVNILAPVHSTRAMYLATLYVVAHRTNQKSGALLARIAGACVVFSLLETWALLLVPVKVFKDTAWTTWWTLPTRTLLSQHRKKKQAHT